MESYFVSETLKYLFLLFRYEFVFICFHFNSIGYYDDFLSDDSVFPLDKYVFNTEVRFTVSFYLPPFSFL